MWHIYSNQVKMWDNFLTLSNFKLEKEIHKRRVLVELTVKASWDKQSTFIWEESLSNSWDLRTRRRFQMMNI